MNRTPAPMTSAEPSVTLIDERFSLEGGSRNDCIRIMRIGSHTLRVTIHVDCFHPGLSRNAVAVLDGTGKQWNDLHPVPSACLVSMVLASTGQGRF